MYHADRTDKEKEDLHSSWQKGKIKVVCATIGMLGFSVSRCRGLIPTSDIAFGLGIDKGDVRFVIHHSISVSLLSYSYLLILILTLYYFARNPSMVFTKNLAVLDETGKTRIVSCITVLKMPLRLVLCR